MKLLNITNKLLNEFLPSDAWHGFKNMNEIILNCIDQNNIKPIDHSWYQSGGGICHYFILDNDEHIWSFHCADEIIQYSYNRWNSIDNYLESDEEKIKDGIYGFGFECENPNYDERYKTKKWFWYSFNDYKK